MMVYLTDDEEAALWDAKAFNRLPRVHPWTRPVRTEGKPVATFWDGVWWVRGALCVAVDAKLDQAVNAWGAQLAAGHRHPHWSRDRRSGYRTLVCLQAREVDVQILRDCVGSPGI